MMCSASTWAGVTSPLRCGCHSAAMAGLVAARDFWAPAQTGQAESRIMSSGAR